MQNQVLEKLPIDLSQLKDGLDESIISQIKEINECFSRFNAEIKKQELEKGIASRKIGEAKKSGEPFEQYIENTKIAAKEIKSLKSQINEIREKANKLIISPPSEDQQKSPGHFGSAKDLQTGINVADITVRRASHSDKVLWDKYVTNHPSSHVYHQFGFHDIVVKSFQQSPIYLLAQDSNNNICGILPSVQLNSKIFGNYVVSVPYFNYGGALADNKAIRDRLMEQLAVIGSELDASHVEFRNTTSIKGLPEKQEKCSMILELPESIEELNKSLSAKVRSQVKKSRSYGLTCKVGKLELLDDFYRVFATNMRDLGTPVYSKTFFSNILKCDDLATNLLIAYEGSNPISCAFLISYKDTMEIPWASTLKSANNKNANMFLYWEVLSNAINSGMKYFDFGRSSKDAGTFKFKKQWGAKEQQLYWQYSLFDSQELPELNPNNPKYQLAISIWKMLPVWVTKIIGPFLVKNLP